MEWSLAEEIMMKLVRTDTKLQDDLDTWRMLSQDLLSPPDSPPRGCRTTQVLFLICCQVIVQSNVRVTLSETHRCYADVVPIRPPLFLFMSQVLHMLVNKQFAL